MATFFLYSRMKNQANQDVLHKNRRQFHGDWKRERNLRLNSWCWWTGPPIFRWKVSLPSRKIVGRILLYPIPQKEPIREQLLAAPGAAIGLTAKIPDGMRAVAVVTNEVNNVSGFLFPGSHVDVLVTFRAETGKEPMTSTVLQNIEVLSTGERLQPDPSGKPQNVKVVTLLMSPEDAQKMSLASNQGTVQFVLRNGADQANRAAPDPDTRTAGSSRVRQPRRKSKSWPSKTCWVRSRSLRRSQEECSEVLGQKMELP